MFVFGHGKLSDGRQASVLRQLAVKRLVVRAPFCALLLGRVYDRGLQLDAASFGSPEMAIGDGGDTVKIDVADFERIGELDTGWRPD